NPGRRAANLPGVAFPGFTAGLAGAGNGVEAPLAFAGGSIVGVDEAANAIFAARDADDDEIFYGQRCESDAVAFAIVKRGGVPNHIAGFGVERDDVRVE